MVKAYRLPSRLSIPGSVSLSILSPESPPCAHLSRRDTLIIVATIMQIFDLAALRHIAHRVCRILCCLRNAWSPNSQRHSDDIGCPPPHVLPAFRSANARSSRAQPRVHPSLLCFRKCLAFRAPVVWLDSGSRLTALKNPIILKFSSHTEDWTSPFGCLTLVVT